MLFLANLYTYYRINKQTKQQILVSGICVPGKMTLSHVNLFLFIVIVRPDQGLILIISNHIATDIMIS